MSQLQVWFHWAFSEKKYEFKKLSKDKASVLLGETATEDMTLADIYHYKEENDYSKKITKKIGF